MMSLDALKIAAQEYARAAAKRPTTDVCSGSLGREREKQERAIELEKLTALEALGRAAIAYDKANATHQHSERRTG
jgi:hypothetical protein